MTCVFLLLFIHALWISQCACCGSVHGNWASATIQGNLFSKETLSVWSELLLFAHNCLMSSAGPDSESQWLVFSYSSGCFCLQPQRQTGTRNKTMNHSSLMMICPMLMLSRSCWRFIPYITTDSHLRVLAC